MVSVQEEHKEFRQHFTLSPLYLVFTSLQLHHSVLLIIIKHLFTAYKC